MPEEMTVELQTLSGDVVNADIGYVIDVDDDTGLDWIEIVSVCLAGEVCHVDELPNKVTTSLTALEDHILESIRNGI